MTRPVRTIDIQGDLIFLGTGTSVGVPVIGCGCSVCTSDDPRNHRLRCSVVLGLPDGNLLVDTTPDLRTQLLREGIGRIDAAVFTHEHADHVMGLDDVRLFPFYLGHPFPLYCEKSVEERIRKSFDYAFVGGELTHPGAVPDVTIHEITTEPFTLLGAQILPLRLQHGRWDVLGFRVGNVAYCTDTNHIPDETWPRLEGLDLLILGALRNRHHPTHFSVEEAVAMARRVEPKRTLLTHAGHELDHGPICDDLPEGIDLAYDGLRLPLS